MTPPVRHLSLARNIAACIAAMAILVGISASADAAQPTQPSSPAQCAPAPTEAKAVTQITSAHSVRLDDGTEVTLTGLIAPTSPDDRGAVAANPWPPERQTLSALTTLLRGHSVRLAYGKHHRDRYGRRPAHLFVKRAGTSVWLQAEAITRGLARVDVSSLDDACAHVLLGLEAKARKQRTGLWANAAYQVRTTDRPWELLRYRSTFQIVEGRVVRTARVRNRIYVNFGKKWRTDFTVGMSQRMLKRFEKTGRRLDQLKGHNVRVRGWIERRGGPFIYLRSPLELEILDAEGAAAVTSPAATSNTILGRHSPAAADKAAGSASGAQPPANRAHEKRPASERPGVVEL